MKTKVEKIESKIAKLNKKLNSEKNKVRLAAIKKAAKDAKKAAIKAAAKSLKDAKKQPIKTNSKDVSSF